MSARAWSGTSPAATGWGPSRPTTHGTLHHGALVEERQRRAVRHVEDAQRLRPPATASTKAIASPRSPRRRGRGRRRRRRRCAPRPCRRCGALVAGRTPGAQGVGRLLLRARVEGGLLLAQEGAARKRAAPRRRRPCRRRSRSSRGTRWGPSRASAATPRRTTPFLEPGERRRRRAGRAAAFRAAASRTPRQPAEVVEAEPVEPQLVLGAPEQRRHLPAQRRRRVADPHGAVAEHLPDGLGHHPGRVGEVATSQAPGAAAQSPRRARPSPGIVRSAKQIPPGPTVSCPSTPRPSGRPRRPRGPRAGRPAPPRTRSPRPRRRVVEIRRGPERQPLAVLGGLPSSTSMMRSRRSASTSGGPARRPVPRGRHAATPVDQRDAEPPPPMSVSFMCGCDHLT